MSCRCHRSNGCGFFVSAGAAFGWALMVLIIAIVADRCDRPTAGVRHVHIEKTHNVASGLVGCSGLSGVGHDNNRLANRRARRHMLLGRSKPQAPTVPCNPHTR